MSSCSLLFAKALFLLVPVDLIWFTAILILEKRHSSWLSPGVPRSLILFLVKNIRGVGFSILFFVVLPGFAIPPLAWLAAAGARSFAGALVKAASWIPLSTVHDFCVASLTWVQQEAIDHVSFYQLTIVFLYWAYVVFLWSKISSRNPLWRKLDLEAYLFLFPALIVLGIFHILPVFYALQLSFYESVSATSDIFVGLKNFKTIYHDPLFWLTLKNTFYYVVCTVPATIVLSLGIAMLLNSPIRGKDFYRTVYFLPVVTSVAAISIVWKWIYNPQMGLLNNVLVQGLGLTQFERYDWLNQNIGFFRFLAAKASIELPLWFPEGPSVAMLCIVVMSVWKGLGYNVVVFLAGLQNIPKELYEVAKIDGAGIWASFRHITWPLLSPTTYFVVIMTTISSFQVFAQIFMMYDGNPSDSTNVIVFYMYDVGFKHNRFGYGSAVAYVLFFMIFLLTVFQKQVVEKRVHYQ